MFASKVLPAILSLDPVRDHERIVLLTYRCDFPFDTTRALEMALFRTFCVPSIGGLLDRTGEFTQRTQKRYDDTDLLVSEVIEHGYSSERGARAIARINELHGRFQISNSDYLYVLSTFIYEPIRWIERFGWRPLALVEKEAMFHFWRAVGERMGITEIPAGFGEFERFSAEYEAKNFQSNPGTKRVAEATLDMFASWMPGPLRAAVPPVMRATLDLPLLRALEWPPAPRWLVNLVTVALRMRGRLASIPPRIRPHLRTEQRTRTYGCVYAIEKLGPKSSSTKA
jgi:hypothetical protein